MRTTFTPKFLKKATSGILAVTLLLLQSQPMIPLAHAVPPTETISCNGGGSRNLSVGTYTDSDGNEFTDGANLTLDAGTGGACVFTFLTTSSQTISLASLTVGTGVTITHPYTDGTLGDHYRLSFAITNAFVLDGDINVKERGYLGGNKPGNASDTGRTNGNTTTGGAGSAVGGSHGGYGGYGNGNNIAAVYDSVTNPALPGGGGGGSFGNIGGNGGGVVRITAGSAAINGSINADGFYSSSGYSGGAGGSIYINVSGALSGAGFVHASSDNTAFGDPGGGGGRIALYYGSSTYSGTLAAHGGNSTGDNDDGSAGTIYKKLASETYGDLTVDNGTLTQAYKTTDLPVPVDVSDQVVAANNGYAFNNVVTSQYGILNIPLSLDAVPTGEANAERMFFASSCSEGVEGVGSDGEIVAATGELSSGFSAAYTCVALAGGTPTVQFTAATSSGAESSTSPSITVALSAIQDVDVTVDYAVQGSSTATGSGVDFTLPSGTLTITAGNTTNTLPLTVIDDADIEADETIVIALSNPTGGSVVLGARSTHTYTITNNDVAPAITLTESGGTTAIEEGGATDSYTLVLTTQPTSDVVVTISSDADSTVNPTEVTFTSLNWSTPQTITITAVDDAIDEGLHSTTITHSVASLDANYNGYAVNNLFVPVTDNDLAPSYCSSTATTSSYEWISNVAVGSFSNASGHPSGYEDFTAQTITLAPGSTPTVTVTPGYSGSSYSEHFRVWIDYNADLDFNDAGELILDDTAALPVAANFTVPNGLTGTTRMRVSMDYGGAPTPCGTASYGQVEDYTVSFEAVVATPGITVTPTSGLTTTESGAGTDTFTVVLDTLPTADVSIGISSTDTTEGTVSPASLTFTTANWSTPQTVTVTGVDDYSDDGNITYTITTAAAVSDDTDYNTLNASDVSATNTDDDVAGFTFGEATNAGVTTEAGGTSAFVVVLNSLPSASVTIGISSSDTTEATVSPASLTFTTGNWNVPQTVTATGLNDYLDDGNVSFSIITDAAVSDDINYSGFNPTDVFMSNADNDTVGITVTPTAGLTTTEAGGTDTFTVVLDSLPSSDVVVGISSSDTSEGTVSPASLTFTTLNWNTPQTVTVTGADDLLNDGNVVYTITTAAAVSDDLAYNGVDASNVSVSNTDNDLSGITVSALSSASTSEAGTTSTFTVVLTSLPTDDVTIGISSSDTREGTVSPASLTFTTLNWDTPQTVTVTGANDDIDDGDVAYSVTIAAAVSNDVSYNGINPTDKDLTNTDDDTVGITVTPTLGLVTTEAGGTDTFTVVLRSEPTADVAIGISSSNTSEGTVSAATLTFTALNWNTPQTVTVTGVNDDVDDGNVSYSIVTAAATSADGLYNGVNPFNVLVSNTDNDTAGITVSALSNAATTEAGGTATFTIVLGSKPTNDVTIGISSTDTSEGTVSADSLTFTALNWDTPQTITVTGVNDDVDDGNVAYHITIAAAVSADASYSGINPTDKNLNNNDNDTAGVTVNPTAGLVTTEAGGTDTFTIVLNSQPTNDVTIGLSSSDTTEATVSAPSLTFTAENWNIAQTVTVTGVDDDTDEGDIAYTITTDAVVSDDDRYSGINPSNVDASNTDNDTAGVTVSAATNAGATTEALGTSTFTVVLDSKPTANVTMALSTSDATEGTVSPALLTFTPLTWNAPQTVTVTGVNDDVDDGNSAYSITLAATSSADPNYDNINPADKNFTNTDNDTAGITITAATNDGATTEGGDTSTFTIVLDTKPTHAVTIGISSSDTNEGTVSAPLLTFTTVNWSTPQTVTVTGVNDDVDGGDGAFSVVIAAAQSDDPNYDGINPADKNFTNTDNDTAGVTVSQSDGTTLVTENTTTDTFTLALASKPTDDVTVTFTAGAQITLSTTALTFTALNWNVPQTVTVSAVDDSDIEAVETAQISYVVTSNDPNFDEFVLANLSITVTDNDTPADTTNSTPVVYSSSSSSGSGGYQGPLPTNTPTPTTTQSHSAAPDLPLIATPEPPQTYAPPLSTPTPVAVGGVNHTVTVQQASSSSITFILQSDPIKLTLKRNEVRDVDTDNDGINDVRVSYKGLSLIRRPKLTFVSLINKAEKGRRVTINAGSYETTSKNVLLTFNMKGMKQMAISNTPDFKDAVYIPYRTSTRWTLRSGKGEKTVYIRFKDAQGTVFEARDTIRYIDQRSAAQENAQSALGSLMNIPVGSSFKEAITSIYLFFE